MTEKLLTHETWICSWAGFAVWKAFGNTGILKAEDNSYPNDYWLNWKYVF